MTTVSQPAIEYAGEVTRFGVTTYHRDGVIGVSLPMRFFDLTLQTLGPPPNHTTAWRRPDVVDFRLMRDGTGLWLRTNKPEAIDIPLTKDRRVNQFIAGHLNAAMRDLPPVVSA